jgi:Na+/H+ antiporter NhaD/arsenite permease-like protein
VLVLLTHTIEQHAAVEAIDWNTLGLLAGMMLMVRVTEPTGVYTWLAIRASQLSKGRPLEIVVSNIGGTATFIGDPPNILIAGATGLSFTACIVNLAPVAAVTLMLVTGGLYLVLRRMLRVAPDARRRVMDIDARTSIEDPDELRRTLPVLVGTILVFFAHQALHIEPATVAMSGATVMLFASRQRVADVLAGIEWPTLFFFIGLFVMVGALEETGAIDEVAHGIASVTDGNRSAELLGITWVSAVGSGLVDNIPFCTSSGSACR